MSAGQLAEFWQIHAHRVNVALVNHMMAKSNTHVRQACFPYLRYVSFEKCKKPHLLLSLRGDNWIRLK